MTEIYGELEYAPFVLGSRRRYSLLVTSVGYERRASHIARHESLDFGNILAFSFDANQVLNYPENREYFSRVGTLLDDAGSAVGEVLTAHLNELYRTEVQAATVLGLAHPDFSVAVDISSMNRDRIALIASALLSFSQPIQVAFLYSPAEFGANLVGSEGSVVVNRPILGLDGWTVDPNMPVTCVIGAGFESRLAMAAIETLEPAETVWLFPQGLDERYDEVVEKRNFGSAVSHLDHVSYYDVGAPFRLLSDLEVTIQRLLHSSRVVIVPLGPKIFALCSILIGLTSDTDVTVWRLSADTEREPEDRAGDRCRSRRGRESQGGRVTVAGSPLRYMGSKSSLARDVHEFLLAEGCRYRTVADLFAGTGTMSMSADESTRIVANDIMGFALCVTRTRVLSGPVESPDDLDALVFEAIRAARVITALKESRLALALAGERRAMEDGWQALGKLIAEARHVGNDSHLADEVDVLRRSGGHRLVELYFAGGYFSTHQAAVLDAFREAVDRDHPVDGDCARETVWTQTSRRDYLLAVWVVAASAMANSPGHTAQFLKSGNERSFHRVKRAWTMDPWQSILAAHATLRRRRSTDWRSSNLVLEADAHEAVEESRIGTGSDALFYADPPYTKDHYSRLYHVLETLYRYDYPDSHGSGRMRSDRKPSSFSTRSSAETEILKLGSSVLETGSSFLLSYPSNGLADIESIIGQLDLSASVRAREVPHQHSTLGARHGRASLKTSEWLVLAQP